MGRKEKQRRVMSYQKIAKRYIETENNKAIRKSHRNKASNTTNMWFAALATPP